MGFGVAILAAIALALGDFWIWACEQKHHCGMDENMPGLKMGSMSTELQDTDSAVRVMPT